MRRRRRSAGMTLVEIMIASGVVAIACAVAFGIHVRLTLGMRAQLTVAETQQTLRAASDYLQRDLRMAGYLAHSVRRAGQEAPLHGVSVANGGTGPDELTILYADTSLLLGVPKTNGSSTYKDATAGTAVVGGTAFAGETVLLATHTSTLGPDNSPHVLGVGCLLGVSATSSTAIITDPALGAPWNQANNAQCEAALLKNAAGTTCQAEAKDVTWPGMTALWNDGFTVLVRPVFRRYRIKPDDPRGVLQVSPTGGVGVKSGGAVVEDWQDLALGVVDMQIALHLSDGTWRSGDNMATYDDCSLDIHEVSVTLLAKSTKDISTAPVARTPDLFDGAADDHNSVGDVAGTTLPVTSTSSPYFGDHIYRTYTVRVSLRNAGAP